MEMALEHIRGKRYRAKPNASFMNQLVMFYEQEVRNVMLMKTPAKSNGQRAIVITLDS